MDESCSETDEVIVKVEKSEKPSGETKTDDSSSNSSGEDSSSTVTVIAAEQENAKTSELTDSVVIVEEDAAANIITIDSQSPQVDTKSQDVIPSSNDGSRLAEEETTFLESSQTDSCNESVKSTQVSFNLALTDSESSRTTDSPEESQKTAAPDDDVSQTNMEDTESGENLNDKSSVTEEVVEVRKQNNDKESSNANGAENAVSAVEETNASASPLSGTSRGLQMLQMVYNSGTPNLGRPQTRFKPNARSPNVTTSPAGNRSVMNGGGTRSTPVNSRNMKMLQANGHVVSPAKPSPSKL
jgi:hypothetical protein